jgi:hypothetical protein
MNISTSLPHLEQAVPGSFSTEIQQTLPQPNPSNVQSYAPDTPILKGVVIGPITGARPYLDPMTGTLEHVNTAKEPTPHPETLQEMHMVHSKPMTDQLPAVPEHLPKNADDNRSEPDGSNNPLLAGLQNSTGDTSQEHRNDAPVRAWTRAVIYPYASQGIMCRGANLAIVTSSGGTPNCLDLYAYNTNEGAQACPPCSK